MKLPFYMPLVSVRFVRYRPGWWKSQARLDWEGFEKVTARWAKRMASVDHVLELRKRAAAGEKLTFAENTDLLMDSAGREMRRDLAKQIWGSKPILGTFSGIRVLTDPHIPKNTAYLLNFDQLVYDEGDDDS